MSEANSATRKVRLILNNHSGVAAYWREQAKLYKASPVYNTRDAMASELKEWVLWKMEECLDVAKSTSIWASVLLGDLMQEGFSQVDWQVLAADFLDEVE